MFTTQEKIKYHSLLMGVIFTALGIYFSRTGHPATAGAQIFPATFGLMLFILIENEVVTFEQSEEES